MDDEEERDDPKGTWFETEDGFLIFDPYRPTEEVQHGG